MENSGKGNDGNRMGGWDGVTQWGVRQGRTLDGVEWKASWRSWHLSCASVQRSWQEHSKLRGEQKRKTRWMWSAREMGRPVSKHVRKVVWAALTLILPQALERSWRAFYGWWDATRRFWDRTVMIQKIIPTVLSEYITMGKGGGSITSWVDTVVVQARDISALN